MATRATVAHTHGEGGSQTDTDTDTDTQASPAITNSPWTLRQPTAPSSSQSTSSSEAPSKSDPNLFASGMSAKRFFGGDTNKCSVFLCTNTIPASKNQDKDEFTNDGDDDDDEAYVCVMDVNHDDFWVIVEPEEEDLLPVNPEPEFDSDQSYEIVDEDGLVSAIASFVTMAIKKYPEAAKLQDYHLKKMLDGTFYDLAEKTTVGKAYNWGCVAYTTYSYGSYAFSIYSDPTMVNMIASGVMTACSWALMLF